MKESLIDELKRNALSIYEISGMIVTDAARIANQSNTGISNDAKNMLLCSVSLVQKTSESMMLLFLNDRL